MTIFAIDFGMPNGDETFKDIASRGIAGHPVVRLPPPGSSGFPAVALSATAYAEHYHRLVAASGQRPTGLLGYCAGGMFAYELAVRWGAEGEPPPAVVMFDTTGTGPAHVANQFVRSMRALGWSEVDSHGVDVVGERDRALTMLDSDLEAGVAHLHDVVHRFVSAFLIAQAVPAPTVPALAGPMAARQAAVLRYVAAGTVWRMSPSTGRRPAGRMAVLVSEDLVADATRFWADQPVRVVPLPCTHAQVLHGPVVRRELERCFAPAVEEVR